MKRNNSHNKFKISDFFGVKELLISFFPILCAYNLGAFPLGLLIIVLLMFLCIIKPGKTDYHLYKPLIIFLAFYLIHDLVLSVFVTASGSYFINSIVEQVIYLASIVIISPKLNANKFKWCLYLVSLVSIIGLTYQMNEILSSGFAHPLEVPGLDMPIKRLENLSARPSSYFMEPAAYVNFMCAPIALSLIEKKYVWSAIIIISMFITTSTTGIISAFILLTAYVLTQNIGWKKNIILLIFGSVLFYSLINLSIFDAGVEKLDTVNTETNMRIRQGPSIVSTMEPFDFVLGVPYANPADYCRAGKAAGANYIFLGDSIYMSTFWLVIFRFGIVGLLFYLLIFYKLYRSSKVVRPYIVGLLATIFTGSFFIGPLFVFPMIVMYNMSQEKYTE